MKSHVLIVLALLSVTLPSGCSSSEPQKTPALKKAPSVNHVTTDLPKETSSPSVLQDLQALEAEGRQQLVRHKLFDAYLRNPDPALLHFWLMLDERVLQELETHVVTKVVTTWEPRQSPPTWKEIATGAVAAVTIPSTIIGLSSGAVAYLGERQRRQLVDYEQAHPIQTCTLDKAKDILIRFDELRESGKQLRAVLEKRAQESTGFELRVSVELLDSQHIAATRVKEARCSYASYNVVSPHLARARQLTYIANISNTLKIGHSKGRLKEAAVILNRGAYGALLEQCHEDVRMQFARLWKEIKEVAGAAELEELKVLQSYSDAVSLDKPSGGDTWWDGK